ncbi:MAG: methylated-DNA--[protein]-cysteine S-methyltransferase [Azoarcus sp.]|nr:methylated-DNA--[protein]-cysteine S-methyltransferase [Azoarcus sp.]
MPPPFDAVLELPFGRFGIRVAREAEAIAALAFLPPDTPLVAPAHPLAALAGARIAAWLDDPRPGLDLPLLGHGSAFQQCLRAVLRAIAPGQTRTYGEIARQLGSSPRAIGQGCACNPFPLVVPCHRVVATNGIGGFAHARDGYLIAAKRWLLAHEAR